MPSFPAVSNHPFAFLAIPGNLQTRILSKADYFTIANFEGTCKKIREKCENLSPEGKVRRVDIYPGAQDWLVYVKNLPNCVLPTDEGIPCSKITAEWAHLHTVLTSKRAGEIIARIRRYNLKAEILNVSEDYDIESLLHIIEELNVKKLVVSSVMTQRKICEFATFRKLETINLGQHDFENEDLLQLGASCIIIECNLIKCHGINSLLLQWKAGQREIRQIVIKHCYFTPYMSTDETLDGLEASVIWDQKCHEESKMPLRSPTFAYSLRKSEDIYNPLIIFFTDDVIEITATLSEVEALDRILSHNKQRLMYYGY